MKKSNDDNVNYKNLEEKYSKTKKVASFKNLKQELKWNKKRNHSFCRGFINKLRLSTKK